MFILTAARIVKKSIEEIYARYGAMMKNLAYSIIRDYQYAEDSVQESLLAISKNLDKLDDVDSAKSKNYIYTVTKNEALTMREKINKNFQRDVQFYDDEEVNNIKGDLDIEAFCDERGLGEDVLELLSSLDELDKDILVYRFADGYSVKEIADMMEKNPDFVYKRIQRALVKLRTCLRGESDGR
jgi:RNA polymerase sigma-70 factor (ECF subfamily)